MGMQKRRSSSSIKLRGQARYVGNRGDKTSAMVPGQGDCKLNNGEDANATTSKTPGQ